MTTTIHTILEEFRLAATSNRDLGDKFERLIAAYLKTDPLYEDKYSDVWLWGEWPDRGNKPDTGIDLVAKERYTGEYCAIQCKFYDPAHTLQKADIDSFFTASGKQPFTSRIIVSTTDKWSDHAEAALQNQHVPVSRMRVQDLADSPVDWSHFTLKRPQDITVKPKKTLRPHQQLAQDKVLAGFKEADRGKLIMACGTGKTFTALKIAEALASEHGAVLFLVPSISLLSQSLREWSAEAGVSLHSFAVCSDAQVGRRSDEDISAHDLAFPATTDVGKLIRQMQAFGGKKQLTVVFSTYQSIKVVSDAQAAGFPDFDLIVCDEAHRTTGVTFEGEDESHFVRVHDASFIKAKKRLYMTATPRIYGDAARTQAQETDAVLCSMDDEKLYGPEFHRLGFSEAVGSGLLADYKVMVLAVDEKYISRAFQSQIADDDNEIKLDDAVRIAGCWNGLSKRTGQATSEASEDTDPDPMRRAVAFSRSINDSKRFAKLCPEIINEYRRDHPDDDGLLSCEVEHVDGTFNALRRNKKLDWLKADTNEAGKVCRILSNARCLSEGVDVPALDAVLFLNPRNSVVDVVQSVGRVMRKAPGKQYGYIILPVGIPADVEPEEALKDNQKYKVVWQVLQALRAHDDRFNATVNQIELNNSRPDQIQVIGVGDPSDPSDGGSAGASTGRPVQVAFHFPNLEEWRDAIYAKIVQKCGDRRYWESWAKDVAEIADRHIARIKLLLEGSHPTHRAAFALFLKGLRENLNPSISQDDAIEMLSQHLITKPVFDALFEGYAFTQHNPVSVAMQQILDALEDQALEKETETLDSFYASVQQRASGIDNAEGRQKIVVELYDKFFKTAFPRMAERLGIVYTPVEIVDFIIRSADEALKNEFGVGIGDAGVHVIDPFTGTGTFLVRLLQSGLVQSEDLARKYRQEMHANEIVLLAYYIATINIEGAYHGITGQDYQPFEGIVLTDTFQMTEGKGTLADEGMLAENSLRATTQNKIDIRVVVGNPPYSVGQDNANDANQNLKYPNLDKRIESTYVKFSTATNKNSLYDSYIRAIRWASDRVKDKGIVCYVTNGSFIDGNAADGLRKCLTDEFRAIYCFNLRGNARTQGEERRREKGNVFGGGSRTPVAMTLLIKNPAKTGQPCKLFYHDIGDYLTREDKLNIVAKFQSAQAIPWEPLTPNASHDWINQRNPEFGTFIPLNDEPNAIFTSRSNGVQTNRDDWVYNFNEEHLTANVGRMIDFYNGQVDAHGLACHAAGKEAEKLAQRLIDKDTKKIKWTRGLIANLCRLRHVQFEETHVCVGLYRPYCKAWLYYDRHLNEYFKEKLYPTAAHRNLSISTTGVGASKEFSCLIVDTLPDLEVISKGQCFPLHFFEKRKKSSITQAAFLEDAPGSDDEYQRKDAITNNALKDFRIRYDDATITKEDVFYYVYGVLHSPEYKQRFASDLKKMIPRIPMTPDFRAFCSAGRELAKWHLDYESVEPYPLQEASDRFDFDQKDQYRVRKMTFGKKDGKPDKSVIVYNSHITLTGIPLEAYEYVVNGKPALEWIMERYQFTRDADSQIANDPNDYSDDPAYILNLVKRIVRVSLETVRIVNNLPALNTVA